MVPPDDEPITPIERVNGLDSSIDWASTSSSRSRSNARVASRVKGNCGTKSSGGASRLAL